ncbi:uncharacterized protein Aud_008372 [Aspergillus udagawae]|uniref:Uncharacterized protein n=1 Tax=Aspergillus udagawae TaxID=91492 RepID=A0A8E0V1W4_9EURO|nr:uncharacterized protein Aud_008372 [Aspergillus udagawae]GIC91918.1 hypothetical protein Aud_008372 [Aspergillus udagawae]
MSDPYGQYPPYNTAAPGPHPSGGAYYAPQNTPHDYGSQQQYGQPGQLQQYTGAYNSQHDLSQQAQQYQQPPQRDFLSPSDALGYQHAPGNHEARGRQGSNAEYYNQHIDEHRDVSRSRRSRSRASSSAMKDKSGSRSRSRSASSGKDRDLAGTLLGGASGYYLGHKQNHGILGALGVSMARIIISAIAIVTIIMIMMMGITVITVITIITVITVIATMPIGIIGAARDIVHTVTIPDACVSCGEW